MPGHLLRPEGRLSKSKLVAYVERINAALEAKGCTVFVEVEVSGDGYALYTLNPSQLRYRRGDRTGESSRRGTLDCCLTAKQAENRLTTFYLAESSDA